MICGLPEMEVRPRGHHQEFLVLSMGEVLPVVLGPEERAEPLSGSLCSPSAANMSCPGGTDRQMDRQEDT